MERILALDVGEKRTGMALSDPLGITAQPLGCFEGDPESEDFMIQIAALIKEKNIREIVVGWPKNLKNEATLSTKRAEKVAKRLEETFQIEVILWDERMSSSQVGRMFQDFGVKKRKRKPQRDVLAAVLILQNYLDYKRLRS